MNRVTSLDSHVVNAKFDDNCIRVYQAFGREIALPAIATGRLASPFKMKRMTWIKPSFNWMMYRSGYGFKPGQEFVLGIDITRCGFEWAMANAALSHFVPRIHASYEAWRKEMGEKPVRIQWDPERDWRLLPVANTRTIQIGLSGEAVEQYVRNWIVRIEDVTALGRALRTATTKPLYSPCENEKPYPLPSHLAHICFS